MSERTIEYSTTGRARDRERWAVHDGTPDGARDCALRLLEELLETAPRAAVFVDGKRVRCPGSTETRHLWRLRAERTWRAREGHTKRDVKRVGEPSDKKGVR